MKTKNLVRVLLFLLPAFGCSLLAMESAQKPSEEPATVGLRNKTGNKLDITYKLTNTNPSSLTLEADEEIALPGTLASLEELYVRPYGQVKGWFSTAILTGGYVKGTNVVTLDSVKKALQENIDIIIIIKPGGQLVEGTVGTGILSSIAASISPYIYEIKSVTKKGTKEYEEYETVTLFNQFPQVLKTGETGKPILPRYVLNIRENADAQTITAAYEKIRNQWKEKTISKLGDEAKLAQKVIEFANEARKSLLGEPNSFEELTKLNFFYNVPVVEKKEEGIEYTILGKESERRLQQMTPAERKAHREAMEDMGFVFDEPEEK